MSTPERVRNAWARARDAFLLREAEAVSSARSAETTALIARLTAAARSRVSAAEQLSGEPDAIAALALYREAAALLVAAIVSQCRRATAAPEVIDPVLVWQALDEEVPATSKQRAPIGLESARRVLVTRDVFAPDRLENGELVAARASAAEVVTWLRARVEPRTVQQIRLARSGRIAALAAALLVGSVAGVAAWRAPKNVARGCPVTASSRLPGTPLPDGATNGDVEPTFGAHTQREEHPWIAVDLTRPHRLREVRIYSRGDAWANETVPLAIEVSEDGSAFTEIRRRITPFKPNEQWSVRLDRQNVRFLRVRMPAYGYIALSEIEAYSER